jgi:hypothetical protein
MIGTGKWKGRSPVDPPHGYGNPYRLVRVAPEHTGQFDDCQLFRHAL